jgi:outer membrane immunogenic protein
MKKTLIAAVALATLIGTPALAADMPLKAPPPPAPIFSWTGFYIGAHGGRDWFHKDWFVPATPRDLAGGCPIPGCNFSAGSHNASGWLAGVQAGFNYQINWAVVGIEAQASWTDLHGWNPDAAFPLLVDNSKTDNLGTIAGRLGAVWDRCCST